MTFSYSGGSATLAANDFVLVMCTGNSSGAIAYAVASTYSSNTNVNVQFLSSYSSTNQLFTGSGNNIIVLPSVITLGYGRCFTIQNTNMFGVTSVYSAGGQFLQVVEPGTTAVLTCVNPISDTLYGWNSSQQNTVSTWSSSAGLTNNTIASNYNMSTSTTPSLTAASALVQIAYNQSSSITMYLPGVSTLSLGATFIVLNASAATVTVDTYVGSHVVATISPSPSYATTITCQSISGDVASSWHTELRLPVAFSNATSRTISSGSSFIQVLNGAPSSNVIWTLGSGAAGMCYLIVNANTASSTLQVNSSSGGTIISAFSPGTAYIAMVVSANGTTPAAWASTLCVLQCMSCYNPSLQYISGSNAVMLLPSTSSVSVGQQYTLVNENANVPISILTSSGIIAQLIQGASRATFTTLYASTSGSNDVAANWDISYTTQTDTTGALTIPELTLTPMTSAAKGTLANTTGAIVYDSTLNTVSYNNGTIWQNIAIPFYLEAVGTSTQSISANSNTVISFGSTTANTTGLTISSSGSITGAVFTNTSGITMYVNVTACYRVSTNIQATYQIWIQKNGNTSTQYGQNTGIRSNSGIASLATSANILLNANDYFSVGIWTDTSFSIGGTGVNQSVLTVHQF